MVIAPLGGNGIGKDGGDFGVGEGEAGGLRGSLGQCTRREAVGLPERVARTPKGPQGAARRRGRSSR